ncbi:MAG: MarR family winged helix-turn-helix transcriptional regulator [Mycobacteriales bacterium]
MRVQPFPLYDVRVPNPRWLDDEEQRAWRAFLDATRRFSDALDNQLQRDAGMPHAYYEILVRLSEKPDRAMRMRDLAEASLASRSRLSHAVARLEERGWVRRAVCPTDKRGQVAQLTDEGFRALAAAAPGHVERVRSALLDALRPDQIRQLREISEAVSRQLDAECGAMAGRPDASADCRPDEHVSQRNK